MPSVGFDLWYFPGSYEFGEWVGESGFVAPVSSDTVLYRTVYVGGGELELATYLEGAKQRLNTHDFDSREDIYILRPTATSDGVPFRAALIYRRAEHTEVQRVPDPRVPHTHRVVSYTTRATRYQAIRGGYAWDDGYALGRTQYFITGSGTAELWRLARLEPDAVGRQLLTLAPVRLPHGLAMPNFDVVVDPVLRQHLVEQFDAFQRGVSSAAHFEVIDRAASIAEGVLDYCLDDVGRRGSRTLADKLSAARDVFDAKELSGKFLMTHHAYHLAHKMRELHARIHADRVLRRGATVRPEVGLSLASDLSEFLVEVGLARY